MFKLKRAYEKPEHGDGARYLVDQLWPRGLRKDALQIDGWLKDVAPSKELRQWFHREPQKWNEFRRRYFKELETKPETWTPLLEAAGKSAVTLVYSARDIEHNNAVALAEYLKGKQTAKR